MRRTLLFLALVWGAGCSSPIPPEPVPSPVIVAPVREIPAAAPSPIAPAADPAYYVDHRKDAAYLAGLWVLDRELVAFSRSENERTRADLERPRNAPSTEGSRATDGDAVAPVLARMDQNAATFRSLESRLALLAPGEATRDLARSYNGYLRAFRERVEEMRALTEKGDIQKLQDLESVALPESPNAEFQTACRESETPSPGTLGY